jgi:hypothetical protein
VRVSHYATFMILHVGTREKKMCGDLDAINVLQAVARERIK